MKKETHAFNKDLNFGEFKLNFIEQFSKKKKI